ncbi:unnamed protein product [Cunninghamella blakesleeana]
MNQNIPQLHAILDSYESTENALMDSFKAAALKVTTLYKDSLVQNRKAYASGYQQALQDLYEFISSHPNIAISQEETPMEHGYLPVQDVLTYARQRNAQLNSEMGLPLDHIQQSPSSSTTTSSSSIPNNNTNDNTNNNNNNTAANTNTTTNNNNTTHIDSPYTNPSSNTNTTTTNNNSNNANNSSTDQGDNNNNNNHSNNNNVIHPNSPVINLTSTGTAAASIVKNAFHPFQIDPNTQFTFSLPVNYHHPNNINSNSNNNNHIWYNNHTTPSSMNHFGNHHHHHHHVENNMNHMNSNIINTTNSNNNNNINSDNINMMNINNENSNNNSGFMFNDNIMKRRMTPNELSFMGRQLNSMNIDSWNEPPMKRRSRRDD